MKDNIRRHLDELVERRSSIYQLLSYVEELDLPPAELDAIRKETAAIVEFTLWQELAINKEKLIKSAASLLELSGMEAAHSFAAWRKALEGGLPSRKSCQLILDGFAESIARVPEPVRKAFTETLPSIARFISDIKPAGLNELIDSLVSLEPKGQAEKYLNVLSAYSETDALILTGASRLICTGLLAEQPELVDRLKKAVTLEMMLESNDACKLLPAAAQLCRKCNDLKPGAEIAILSLVVTAAEQSVSSAYATVKSISKATASLSPDKMESLLRSITNLVDQSGIRVLGAALKVLPGLYGSHPIDTVEAFAGTAAESGGHYGTTAAEWFLLRKTEASRAML